MRKIFFIFISIMLIVASSYLLFSERTQDSSELNQVPQEASTTPKTLGVKPQESGTDVNGLEKVNVIRVIDGDTVELEGGQKVRYIGIDTPETSDPRKPVQCFAKEASEKNKELVEGKEVSLEKDITEADKYSRLLRYVYLDNIFINDYLVRQGYASSYTYPPDIKYQEQFTSAQKEAQENKRGLWSACSENPESESLAVSGSNGCQIKGNISSSGEKIYHMPHQRYYDKTVVDESKGEKWFCTEDEAISAGWRKSKI